MGSLPTITTLPQLIRTVAQIDFDRFWRAGKCPITLKRFEATLYVFLILFPNLLGIGLSLFRRYSLLLKDIYIQSQGSQIL